jgi:DNA repair protein RecO
VTTITDQAIVIRQWDFSETSQTVSLFTRDHGVIRGLAKGARREKGSFSGGLDVLTGGQIVAIVKPGRELSTLTAWHVQQMYPAVRQSLAANRIGLYMADLVHHMIIDHDPHPAVFEALAAALERLNDAAGRDRSLLRFQWQLLQEAGYEPQVQVDAITGRELLQPAKNGWFSFSARAGGLVAEDAEQLSDTADSGPAADATIEHDRSMMKTFHGHSPQSTRFHSERGAIMPRIWKVRPDTVSVLRHVCRGEDFEGSPESISRANRLLAAYFREIIGSEPPAMRWAFSDLAEPAGGRA